MGSAAGGTSSVGRASSLVGRADSPVGRADSPVGRADSPVMSEAPRPGEVVPELPADVQEQVQRVGSREIALGILTYNNATTVRHVAETAVRGVEKHFSGRSAALVNADAGSADATRDLLAGIDLPALM